MKIEVQHRGRVAIVRPLGQYTAGDGDLPKVVVPLIEQRGAAVVIDLSGVDFIGSAGLGELVRITAQANTQGARVVLAAVSPFVRGVMATTRLDRFFEISGGVDEAAASLGA